MNVITTGDYVAGIFAEWSDTQKYIGLKPDAIRGYLHTNSDLTYPFYLVQTGRVFVGCQTIEDVRRQAVGIIVFTITEDYQPHVPWNDEMGSLEHEHLHDMDDDDGFSHAYRSPTSMTEDED